MYDYNPYKSQYVVDHFAKEALISFREAVRSWDGYQCYLPKLDHFIDNVAEIVGNSFIPNNPSCGVNVLNHGDFHMRNILLKNNHDKRLESVRFVMQFILTLSTARFKFFLHRLTINAATTAVLELIWLNLLALLGEATTVSPSRS